MNAKALKRDRESTTHGSNVQRNVGASREFSCDKVELEGIGKAPIRVVARLKSCSEIASSVTLSGASCSLQRDARANVSCMIAARSFVGSAATDETS